MSSGLSSVSAIAVLDLRQVLLGLSVINNESLFELGLTDRQLLDPQQRHLPIQEQRVAESHFLKLWSLAANHKALPHIGLLIGQHYRVESRGLLANWLFQCDTLQQSLNVLIKHMPLMNPSEHWLVSEVDADHIRLTLEFDAEKKYPQAAIERSLTALMVWCQELTGEPVPVRDLFITAPKSCYHHQLVDLFGERIAYAQSHNSIEIPKAYLQKQNLTRNPYLNGMMQKKAGNALTALQHINDPVVKIEAVVSNSLAAVPDINGISQQLNVSRATLYRQLKEQGTSYSAIVSQVQKKQAGQWLVEGKAVNAISIDLGFSDTSAFYKAFKRWYGMTPAEFKRGHSNPGVF